MNRAGQPIRRTAVAILLMMGATAAVLVSAAPTGTASTTGPTPTSSTTPTTSTTTTRSPSTTAEPTTTRSHSSTSRTTSGSTRTRTPRPTRSPDQPLPATTPAPPAPSDASPRAGTTSRPRRTTLTVNEPAAPVDGFTGTTPPSASVPSVVDASGAGPAPATGRAVGTLDERRPETSSGESTSRTMLFGAVLVALTAAGLAIREFRR
ncbi:hypothetical protein [Luteipulveratus flavus]|uniref:Gram-positive cocci surface proteins LPxTG domain-containing protein n=1 Tax=Luteipulveratus flavus TaxID=3031728 RepID=A0ABT6CAJ8_9MICO|nr:hypothetical protein [Luteipulveratus sp. YIM 133296]MDF8265397.1 hypothetical protein [Luteipulveratus sp. YIM 133296]